LFRLIFGKPSKKTKINDTTSESVESISSRLSNVKNDKATTESEEAVDATEEPKFEEQSNKASLNDLNEQLIQLNTSIRQLIQHSAESVETAGRQIKATKSLSGNRFA
jgi:TolA-binding protein